MLILGLTVFAALLVGWCCGWSCKALVAPVVTATCDYCWKPSLRHCNDFSPSDCCGARVTMREHESTS